MAFDPVIASKCPARFTCKQHEVMCATTCPLFIDIRYQVELSGIPKRHTKFVVQSLPHDSEHLTLLHRYTDDDMSDRVAGGKGLYLHGTVGNGKTTSVCTVAMTYVVRQSTHAIRTGIRTRQLVQFVNVPELLDDIRAGFGDDDKRATIDRTLNALQTVPLAIFDDIGSEKPSEWVRERLLQIIGNRYDNELATFFTSNLTLAELREPLGPRLASRIEGMAAPIQFRGPDRRRKI